MTLEVGIELHRDGWRCAAIKRNRHGWRLSDPLVIPANRCLNPESAAADLRPWVAAQGVAGRRATTLLHRDVLILGWHVDEPGGTGDPLRVLDSAAFRRFQMGGPPQTSPRLSGAVAAQLLESVRVAATAAGLRPGPVIPVCFIDAARHRDPQKDRAHAVLRFFPAKLVLTVVWNRPVFVQERAVGDGGLPEARDSIRCALAAYRQARRGPLPASVIVVDSPAAPDELADLFDGADVRRGGSGDHPLAAWLTLSRKRKSAIAVPPAPPAVDGRRASRERTLLAAAALVAGLFAVGLNHAADEKRRTLRALERERLVRARPAVVTRSLFASPRAAIRTLMESTPEQAFLTAIELDAAAGTFALTGRAKGLDDVSSILGELTRRFPRLTVQRDRVRAVSAGGHAVVEFTFKGEPN